jgi:hypothetical protein
MGTTPNAQYNLAAPDSVAVRLAGYQRRRMFDRFLAVMAPAPDDTILDIGVTSDRSYPSSNYFEKWYPHKAAVTAAGLDDAAFLEKEFPGLRYVRADACELPFADRSFDFVHSSAVIEHVGSAVRQARMIAECARVARKGLFLTTPNRWFPVEFHTVVPLLHWLPPAAFRAIMRRTGRDFFAEEANLNLMSGESLRRAAIVAGADKRFAVEVESVALGGWPSNLLLVGKIR